MYTSTNIRETTAESHSAKHSLDSDLRFDLWDGTAASREASDKVSHDLALRLTIGVTLGTLGFEGTAKFTGTVEVTEWNLRPARSSCTRSGSGRSTSESLSLW